jgi:hypothetical protein
MNPSICGQTAKVASRGLQSTCEKYRGSNSLYSPVGSSVGVLRRAPIYSHRSRGDISISYVRNDTVESTLRHIISDRLYCPVTDFIVTVQLVAGKLRSSLRWFHEIP